MVLRRMTEYTSWSWLDDEGTIRSNEGADVAWVLYPPGCNVAERDANARLIAAAPDLLEACEAAKGLYWRMIENLPKEHYPEAEHLWDKLTQAIAKAKRSDPDAGTAPE